VPHIRSTLAGQPYGWAEANDGSWHILRVVTWINGEDLGKQIMTPTLLRSAGGAVARLTRALRSFYHHSARHPLLWDITQVTNLRTLTHHIKDKESRNSVELSLDSLITDILPGLSRLRHQIIHNDANGDNMIVDPDNRNAVAGIIDFGDMIHTVLAADPAVTAADLTQRDCDILDTTCEIVAGYDAINPLEEEEIDILYDLIVMRYALTLVIIAWRNSQPDGAGYLKKYEKPVQSAQEFFLTIGRYRVRRSLREACRYPEYCPTPGETDIPKETDELLTKRNRYLGKDLELFYDNPVHVVKGKGTWLFAADGQRLLDAYNNVPQVGHAHPHIVRTVARQAAAFNINTRYLYRIILDYAERLTATMPNGLEACLFVNSGSEANDIAFRMAKLITGNQGAIVMEAVYHGISEAIDTLALSFK
jgi:Ser/Thr protein kinase RdoA (MazF antagonist)